MATSIATISWTFVPGSISTLVEYRVDGTTTWLQPSSPTNPTPGNTYPLTINNNTVYNVRLTTNATTCGPVSTTFNIQALVNNCCPVGYTLSADTTYCYKTTTTAATPPSSPENTVAESYHEYSCYGSLIYDPGYASNGTGTFTQIPYSNLFWLNGTGFPSTSGNTVNGPMNRTALWATTTFDNQTVGFTVCITTPTNGVYYVGCAADDYATIKLDGNTVVQMDIAAMNAFISSHGYAGAIATPFRFWHIYPVTLLAGSHVLEIIGNNLVTLAGFGAEIYNLTSAQIQAATSYVAMGSGLVFSTKDYVGQPVQVGSGGIGYSCPSGYSLVLCSGPAFCTQTLIAPTQSCGTTTTTTTTTTTSTTSTSTTTTTSTSTTTTSTSTSTTTSTSTSTTSTTSTTTSTTSSTTTTTTTAGPTVTITNNRASAVIGNVSGISGFAFGSPIGNGGSQTGNHTGFTGGIAVTITSGPASNSNLYLTGAHTDTIPVTAGSTGIFTFASFTYLAGDQIDIALSA